VRPVSIRRAEKADVGEAVDLVVRLKKLNNEFDPLLGVTPDAKARAEAYVSESLESPKALLMVATENGKVIGVIRGEVRERLFYEPRAEGYITEMYVLPEHRRKGLGEQMLDRISTQLVKRGAEMILADLPSRNEIGVSFYAKKGFRRLSETLVRLP
jgi:ribosomal protein S18 acetylase RimI-like enzyme